VFEELLLASAPEQPDVALDPCRTDQDVETAGPALVVESVDGHEAVGWVDAPQLIGHQMRPAQFISDFMEAHPRLEPQVEVEGVEDSLGDFAPRSYADSVGWDVPECRATASCVRPRDSRAIARSERRSIPKTYPKGSDMPIGRNLPVHLTFKGSN
jgi:hypothetical protein